MADEKIQGGNDGAELWRARAKQARDLALVTVDEPTLEQLERRAVECEQLAETLERANKPEDATDSGDLGSRSSDPGPAEITSGG